ncbi:hypothetical protein BHE74_00008408 [Ensete ventricosum]|uniref:Uncharacterized protein n=1 Tax=Ensete ventricosum TaxID=4639 RepID=A0A444EI38_ENSVE|nr:hypothetical protein GW17_00026391 [Ensete ventricosum]RWW83089.1 hypothetical protein BHE74_00008408 [Ensete ventricosum]RZR74354.1 hypothetical protein BHM03_00035832 [Ensete ventricosum]
MGLGVLKSPFSLIWGKIFVLVEFIGDGSGWFRPIGSPPRRLRRLPLRFLRSGPLVVFAFSCYQCLIGRVLVGILEHLGHGR